MLYNLAEEHELLAIGAIILLFSAIAVALCWIFASEKTRPFIQNLEGVVPPFLGLPAILFSLTVALMATSIWENYTAANRSVRDESLGLLTIIELSSTVPGAKGIELARYAENYAKSVVDDEWMTLSARGQPSVATKKHFDVLRLATFDVIDSLNKNAKSTELMNAIERVNDARKMRLSFVTFDTHPIRGYAAILLAVLVQISVALVHISKPKVLPIVMVITSLTILIPICTMALTLSSPYGGWISISNTPFSAILGD